MEVEIQPVRTTCIVAKGKWGIDQVTPPLYFAPPSRGRVVSGPTSVACKTLVPMPPAPSRNTP